MNTKEAKAEMSPSISVPQRHEPAPLDEFIAANPPKTGDPLEPVVLAEMAGYTAAEARKDGYESLFEAVADLAPPESTPAREVPEVPELSRRRLLSAFVRGLLFIMPLAPLFVLLPRGLSGLEHVLVTLAVIAAWGLGMGLSNVTRRRQVLDPGTVWRSAIRWSAAVLGSFAALGLVSELAVLDLRAVVIGWAALHVLYVLAANVLMVTHGARMLALTLAPGVLAAGVHLASGGTLTSEPGLPTVVLALGSVVAAIVVSLVRVLRRAEPSTGTGVVADGSTPSFVVYGALIAVIVLWLPISSPSAITAFLGLALIACLGLAEVAARYVRRSGRRTLARTASIEHFQAEVGRTLTRAIAGYAAALSGVLLLIAVPLLTAGFDPLFVILDGLAVLLLGNVQILALLGVSFHAMRRINLTLATGAVGLLGVYFGNEMTADSILTPGFLGTLLAVAGISAVITSRAARVPVNHW